MPLVLRGNVWCGVVWCIVWINRKTLSSWWEILLKFKPKIQAYLILLVEEIKNKVEKNGVKWSASLVFSFSPYEFKFLVYYVMQCIVVRLTASTLHSKMNYVNCFFWDNSKYLRVCVCVCVCICMCERLYRSFYPKKTKVGKNIFLSTKKQNEIK